MIRLFVRHRVTDDETGRKGDDAFDAHRPSFGLSDQAVYRVAGAPGTWFTRQA